MSLNTSTVHDVMQVCRNGHVITDLLHTFPERGQSHCDRCGAATLSQCPTCGRDLPGGVSTPGLVPIRGRLAPQFCAACGTPFPWASATAGAVPATVSSLESFLTRLPRTIRELRCRHGERPTFIVNDDHDLTDLVRAVLPLHCDDIRLESRTPAYASRTSTDFLLQQATVALVCKRVGRLNRDRNIKGELADDAAYHGQRHRGIILIGFIYDPEGLVIDARQWQTALSNHEGEVAVHCLIAT